MAKPGDARKGKGAQSAGPVESGDTKPAYRGPIDNRGADPLSTPDVPRAASGPVPPTYAVSPLTEQPLDHRAAISIRNLSKSFGGKLAVGGVSLDIPSGSFYGIVGPNGAGKTTTLSMATGLLRPDLGRVSVHGIDVWRDPAGAKKQLGVLPDGLRLFDRLTGAQLIAYAGELRGLDRETVRARTYDLLATLGLADDADTLVVDYSAGMTKKVALASALIHAPRVIVLDEPFESVDPVSAAGIRELLTGFVASGGTVVVSSHVMDLVQRMCSHVAVVARGLLLASGTVDDVRAGESLEDRFVQLVGGAQVTEGLSWLQSS
ncbi:ABC transporter ATP-binding protein [Mumia sp. zg.B53]|nr:ABC transporter ATP-binding protein [Mumia sp. zg.B53]